MDPDIWVKTSESAQAEPLHEVIATSIRLSEPLPKIGISPSWSTNSNYEIQGVSLIDELNEQKEKVKALSDENEKLKEELRAYREIKEYF